jgi:hypothetical protein
MTRANFEPGAGVASLKFPEELRYRLARSAGSTKAS